MRRFKTKNLAAFTLVCTMVYIVLIAQYSLRTQHVYSKRDIINILDKVGRQIFPSLNSHTQNLFEYAARLNNSKLKECSIEEKQVTISDVTESNKTHTYICMVPKWQSKPRKAPYFLTAVVRVRLYREDKAKWTLSELKQWIHYQLWAGAEHIYVCNHYLKPEERIVDKFQKYKQAGLVTVIDWNKIESIPGSNHYSKQNADNQVGCYNHVLKKWGHMTTWMYNFDMDENPYCPQDYCEGFLSRFLQNPTNQIEKNAGLLLLENFILMGQGDRSRDIFYDRINRITPRPANGNVKCIFRTSWTREAGMHNAKLLNGTTVRSKPLRLKMVHYWGARTQNWGKDTKEMLRSTVEFNDVRDTIAIAVRHSLLAFGDYDSFNKTSGP